LFSTIKQFTTEEESYILIISYSNHSILNSEGNLLYTIDNNRVYYKFASSVIPYKYSKDVFYYYIISFDDTDQMILSKYSYYSTNKTLQKNNFNFKNIYELVDNSITCQLMKYSNENVISCFFPTIIDNETFINCTVFQAEENFEIIKTSKLKIEGILSRSLKSEVMSNDDRQKVLIIFFKDKTSPLSYVGYDININNFTYRNLIQEELQLYYGTNADLYNDISYFKETEEFIISFYRKKTIFNGTEYHNVNLIYSIDKNFEYSFLGILGDFMLGESFCKIKPFTITEIQSNYFSNKIFFSSVAQKYCIILNLNSPVIISLFIINKEIKINNPTELKSADSQSKFICENYKDDYLYLLENNFIEKCTNEIDYIISNFTCNCSEKYPYKIIETHKCVEYCDENSLSNGSCILEYSNTNNDYSTDSITEEKNMESDNNISSDENIITKSTNFVSDSQTIIHLNMTNKIETEEELYDLFNTILNEKIDNNKNYIEKIQNIFSDNLINNILDNIINEEKDITIRNNDTIIQITSTDNQRNSKNHNISTIDLGICEKTLKNIYKIDENKTLLILKIDSFIDGSKIPVIQYEVYHPDNKSKLNLNFCNNNIEINIPVLVDENNLYKYEQDSDYYNDRCYSNVSDNGNDKPIDYRRKEFVNNNMSLCESECNYLGYDFDTKNSKCECEIKKEMSIFNIKIDTQRLFDKFIGLTSSNIDIIKCYYLLLKKENLIYNIGFYIILFIIFLFCIGGLTFIYKGYYFLVQKINIIISITKKTNKINDTNTLISKNEIKRNKSKKNRNRKKNRKNNLTIKKVNNNHNKKINNKLNLTDETKSIRKLKSKSNESLIKNANTEKGRKSKVFKKNKKIMQSKLVIDNPNSKMNSLNNSKRYLNDYEMNRLKYKDAIRYDRRTYMQYYWSLLKMGNLFLFSFIPNNDYNSMVIKICLFFFSFGLYYTVNALFFTDSTMNKIYEDSGEYDFIYQIPKLLYSNLICTVINLIVRFLSLSEKDILKIKTTRKNEDLERKVENIKNCLKIKFILYYLVSFLFLFIFWFYISCFCAVYKNTKIYLIKDTLISFSLSLLYPLGYYLIPGLFRLLSLRKRNNECIYKLSLLLQLL